MPLTREFLRAVQRHGWQVVRAEHDRVLVQCSARGCGLRVALKSTSKVPNVNPASLDRHPADQLVSSYHVGRDILRDRRQEMRLSIAETEEACGMAGDLLAKIEATNSQRSPSVQTFVDWANTLGYEVVLRPTELPSATVRAVLQAKEKVGTREQRNKLENERRAGKRDG